MKSFFHKILSVSMTLLVLFSTFSFTVDNHYCGDFLVDSSLLGVADTCNMESQDIADSSDCNFIKKNCCSNETIIINGRDDLKISFENLSFEQQLFVASFIYSYISIYTQEGSSSIPFQDYSPPLLTRDVQILDQTFLI